MGTEAENIAVMSVIWRRVSEKVTAMNDADFEREKAYQTTMSLVRQLKKNGAVTDEEYRKIDTIMLEKYRPILGTLLSGNPLT